MEELLKLIKFDDRGLIPAVTQDYKTDEVLMLAYMNKEAIIKTFETGKVNYWSRSRNKLWLKGETSGHFQELKSISVDCDGDALLIKAQQKGAACHTGHHSCFYTKFDKSSINENEYKIDNKKEYKLENEKEYVSSVNDLEDENLKEVLNEVYEVILDRKINPKEGSYTNYLFEKGLDKILKKVGEESSEVIIASKNKSNDEIKYEISDLFYHICVLMVERGIELNDIFKELKRRR